MLFLILATFVTIYIPTASTQQNSITPTTTGDVVLGSDAVLTWEVKIKPGMSALGENIHNGTKDGPLLWNNVAAENELQTIFGERATVQKKNIANGKLFEIKIKNANFNDSTTFTLVVAFAKAGTFVVEEKLDSTIQLKVSAPTTTSEPTTTSATGKSPPASDSNVGAIVGGVLAAIIVIVIIIIAVVCFKKKRGERTRKNTRNGSADDTDFSYHKEPTSQYAPVGTGVASYESTEPARNPPKEKYSKLGPGGRSGPKDHVTKTQYAEAKTHDDDEDDGSKRYSNLSADDNHVSDSIIV